MRRRVLCFSALSGERSNGCDFLGDVAERGAYAAVVPKSYTGSDFGMTLFHVDDVVMAMHKLAKSALKERSSKVIGITGSVGKTTTRHFLTQLLQERYSVAYPPKNYNSQRTMPLVVLNAKGDEDFLILEMGMDRPSEIEKLVDIAPPDYVILTAIVLAHYFGDDSTFQTLDEVAREKTKIFCDRTEFAVIHAEAALFECTRDACMCEHVVYPSFLDFEFPFHEEHIQECLSAAIEMALHLGVSEKRIKERLPLLKTFERRFEKIKKNGITFINDSYNCVPIAAVTAFRNLPKTESGKTIAVFGSMDELGKFSLGAHMQVGREALKKVDELLCIGEDCRPIVEMFKSANKKAELFETKEALQKAMNQRAEAGDVVLVKGSNFHHLWEVIPK